MFMGSPEFALPSLRALAGHYRVVGVITQPDRPAGRGRVLSPPPVKTLAESLGLPVIQPLRLKEPEAMQQLRDWKPELIVVAAFGQILKPEVLELPRLGCINVHASLLPRWRGAAPAPSPTAALGVPGPPGPPGPPPAPGGPPPAPRCHQAGPGRTIEADRTIRTRAPAGSRGVPTWLAPRGRRLLGPRHYQNLLRLAHNPA